MGNRNVFFLLVLALLVGLALPSYAATLIAHWDFDNILPGGIVQDKVGSANGTITGNISSSTDSPDQLSGNTLDFGGATGDFLAIDNSSNLFDFRTTDDFSFSFWANPDLNGQPSVGGFNHRLFAIRNGANQTLQLILREGNVVRFGFAGVSGAQANPDLVFPLNEWSHIAAVKEGNNYRIYHNGVDVTNGSVAGGDPQPAAGSFTIGNAVRFNNSNSGPYDGQMDDFQVFTGALTSEEVENLFVGGGNAVPEANSLILLLLAVGGSFTYFGKK